MKKVGSFIWWTTKENPNHVCREFYPSGVKGWVIPMQEGDQLEGEAYLNEVIASYRLYGMHGYTIDQIGISDAFAE